jgi:UDP-GlcNAc:undecaprenyl-phosphate GlcNAc-1-phosphate transferase
MKNQILLNIILITFSCFLLVSALVPIIKKIAIHVNAMDIPNKRKVHTTPIPRLGGLAIYIGFLFGYLCFMKINNITTSILVGSFIILLTGIIDDIKPLDAKYKLIGQILASLVVVFYGKILLQNISAFGIYIDFGIFSYIITIILILACINCMNLIDGLDGLAAGISSIYFLTIGIITIFLDSNIFDYTLCFIMLGSSLGFLVHNYHPAKIFMGDSGSMFLGFIVGVTALLGFKNVTLTSFFIPFMVIAIPFLDTFFAIIRRSLKKEKITTPDKFHIHHQLLNMNFSHKTTVIIIWIIDLLFAIASIIYVLVDNNLGYLIYGILLILVFIFVINTNVVFDFKKENLNIFKKIKR